MVSSGVLLDAHMAYFDARLAERYPTVELRVADVCLDVADTVLVGALTRAPVETAARERRAGEPVPAVSTGMLRLATWRASRSGLTGPLLDPAAGGPRTAATVVGQLVDHVAPALRDAGDLDLVERSWADLQARSTGADRQRQAASEGADLAAVVREAVRRTV